MIKNAAAGGAGVQHRPTRKTTGQTLLKHGRENELLSAFGLPHALIHGEDVDAQANAARDLFRFFEPPAPGLDADVARLRRQRIAHLIQTRRVQNWLCQAVIENAPWVQETLDALKASEEIGLRDPRRARYPFAQTLARIRLRNGEGSVAADWRKLAGTIPAERAERIIASLRSYLRGKLVENGEAHETEAEKMAGELSALATGGAVTRVLSVGKETDHVFLFCQAMQQYAQERRVLKRPLARNERRRRR